MLIMMAEGRSEGPVITCDGCGAAIKDARTAYYEWQVNEEGRPLTGAIYYTHRACSRVQVELPIVLAAHFLYDRE